MKFSNWFIKQLWYDDFFEWSFIPSLGSSGGILSIWDSNRFTKEDERKGYNNLSTLFVNKANGFKWAITNIYSPCDYYARAEFLEDLEEVRHWWAGPILFEGDFNAVRSDDERNRGEADSRNSGFLNNFILQQELVD